METVTRIYHASDIHIRVLERHDEYISVFDNLHKILLAAPEDSVFVVCGDIMHNRDKLLSETIRVFDYFIKSITSVMDLIIIPGNHDIYEKNTDRLDIIEGMLEIGDYRRLIYINKVNSKVQYKDIVFHYKPTATVSSDTQQIKADGSDFVICPGKKKNILLYHGLLNVCPFSGDYYDCILMGDCHTNKILSPEEFHCNAAYSGSLIQQNFREKLEHGIMIWDLNDDNSFTPKFRSIHNDFGFVTVNKGNYKDTVYPKFSRVRVEYTKDSMKEISDWLSERDCLSIIPKPLVKKAKGTEGSSGATAPVDYFGIALDKRTDIPDDVKDKVRELYSLSMKDPLHETNEQWYISSVEFKNMLVYGDSKVNKINFEDMESVVGIIGSNAIGKTSIFNIILYGLFGTVNKLKSSVNSGILNKKSKDFYIKIHVKTYNGKEYIIYRQGKAKNRTGYIGNDSSVTFYVDGKNITDSDKYETERVIRTRLGTDKESFIFTNFLSYSCYKSILNMTSRDVTNIFNDIFDLDECSTELENTKQKLKAVKKEVKDTEYEINRIYNKGDVTSLEHLRGLLHDITTELEAYTEVFNDVDTAKSRKEILATDIKYYNEIKPDSVLLGVTELPYITLDNAAGVGVLDFDTTESIRSLEIQEELLLDKIRGIPSFSTVDYEKNNTCITSIEAQIFLLDLEISESDNAVLSKREYVLASKSNESIKYAITNVLDYIKYNKDSSELDRRDYIQTLEYLLNESNILLYAENIRKVIQKDHKKLVDSRNKSLNQLSDTCIFEYNKILYSKKCLAYNKLISKYNSWSNSIAMLQTKESSMYRYTELIKEGKAIEMKIDKKISDDALLKKLQKSLNEAKGYMRVLEYYIETLMMIPKITLENIIKDIQENVNIVTQNILMIKFSILPDNLSDKYSVYLEKDNVVLGPEQLSGYERFVLDLSVKTAINSVTRKGSVLFIDEMIDCVAETNLYKIESVLEHIKAVFKNVLIISHNKWLSSAQMIESNIDISFHAESGSSSI